MLYKGVWVIKEVWLSGTVRYILKDGEGNLIPLPYDLTIIDEAIDYIDCLDLDKQLVLI